MGEKKGKTKVRPHRRKNRKKDGTHKVSGHTRRVGHSKEKEDINMDELSEEAKFHMAMENEAELIDELLSEESSFSITDYDLNRDSDIWFVDFDDKNDLRKVFDKILTEQVRPVLIKHDYTRDEETGELMRPSEGFGSYTVHSIDKDNNTFYAGNSNKFEYELYDGEGNYFELIVDYIPYEEREAE